MRRNILNKRDNWEWETTRRRNAGSKGKGKRACALRLHEFRPARKTLEESATERTDRSGRQGLEATHEGQSKQGPRELRLGAERIRSC